TAAFNATHTVVPGGTITLTAPADTAFTPGFGATIVDRTNPAGSGGTSGGAVDAATPNTVTFTVFTPIAANDRIQISVDGVTNSATPGTKTLTVRTSSDATPASASYAITAATSVTNAGLALSSVATSATGVGYTVNFGSTHALPAGTGILTVVAPTGNV